MKFKFFFLILLPFSVSCSGLGGKPEGELRISFDDEVSEITRSDLEIPDTSDFILSVKDADGDVIYEGSYGESPESIKVDEGSYTVKVVSGQFDRPAFSAPQFGDEQCVLVPGGGAVNVRLNCVQLNAGVRLRIDSGFLSVYPSSALLLRSEEGSLIYSYKEKRTAYFKPGKVSLVMTKGAEDKVLMSRHLEAQEILSLGVSVMSSEGGQAISEGISVAVDTSRVWLNETFVIDGSGKGNAVSEALTVTQARNAVGEEAVWVSGYVVGGDLTSSSASFEEPFSSRTNILLGSRTSTDDRESCLSVQLASGGVRDSLNLVDNPQLLGKKILVRGDVVEQYYGLTGLKNIVEFKIL